MPPKMKDESIKKIEVAFLERFFAKRGPPDIVFGSLLAAIFDQKSQKRHQKRHAKIDVEKVSKNNAKSDQK